MPEQANTPGDSEVASPPDIHAEAREVRQTLFDAVKGDEACGVAVRFNAGRAIGMLERLSNRLAGMTLNRDNFREYLAEAQGERDSARAMHAGEKASADRTRSILRAVMEEATRPPAWIAGAVEIPPGKRNGTQAALVGLWQHQCTENALRFVAELATMTDNEAEFLDGYELRAIARMLQVPDENGERAPTVPRLYSDEDRERAIAAITMPNGGGKTWPDHGAAVDAVAEALGMRRAGA